ncbi:AraC family transcriptional regulator [Paenibacillus sp. KQZ6P-2]|uniref:AraC family transcriptional regulator n=1 Tax=Paenibacillus mangrovi TaxID=2931978 RepID=A0A9X2B3D4_9BACL|nr:AraC family transcriptional regulator [Paenibacillus mangrovi]MCJ8013499.1 AraC family transcriptional regulator [Paenibacillus mangrovi]
MRDFHKVEVEKAIHFMKNHLDEDITSEQIAAEIGYSPYHFTRIFKSVTGVSPRHYLAALRIEKGKKEILNNQKSLLKVILSIGYRSVGSFNTRFRDYVGVTPKKFFSNAKPLTSHMNKYHDSEIDLHPQSHTSTSRIICRIDTPDSFKGIIFVGLFPKPIPDQRPVVGTALNRNGQFHLCGIPNGTYYVLATGIPWSMNPRDYFILDHSLRGMYSEAIHVTEQTDLKIAIKLREPLISDPPIVINLPLLLFEHMQQK